MPLLKVQTNVAVAPDERTKLCKLASRTVAELLMKPESYVVVTVEPGVAMTFGGSTQPAAYVELKSIGLPEHRTPEFSRQLCNLLSAQLHVATNRIYIEFATAEPHLWGWNSGTFADD